MLAGAEIQMRSSNNFGVYTMGQIFTFCSMTFVANPAGHLEPVETLTVGRVFLFNDLEFVADSRGEIVLCSLVPYRAQEQGAVFCNPPTSHFIANVESIHDVLKEHDEPKDEMEEDEHCPAAPTMM